MKRTQTIKNKMIMKIHGIFKELRDSASQFFKQPDQSLIRFTFGETPTYFQFKVKFGSTHKLLKFIVNKDPDVRSVGYVMYEKTKNIVMDIDQIYRERQNGYSEIENMRADIARLFWWGIRQNKNRERETFRVPAITIKPGNSDNRTNKDVLYYGIIENFNVERLDDQSFTVSVWLHTGSVLKFPISETSVDFADILKKNKLLVMNYLGRYTAMSFTSAKHHINFTEAQYQEISTYLLAQRKV